MADMKVTVIPATKSVMESAELKSRKMRVAAYCRVSTDSEEQLNSYETQKTYYTQLIADNPNWDNAGIYADEGISGTDMKKRDSFNRMIAACKRGRIDMILTKSLSRFARNTVDCLDTIRMLKARNIGVLFEKENINTLTESSEFLITLFSSFAQAESESLSKNVSWGIRKSMEAGNVPMHYATLLGYQEGPDGNPEIAPEEAETVRQIYRWYIKGLSLAQIQKELEIREMKTAKGSTKWSRNTVQSILTNEKYIGNAILQKTFTVDCISKKVRKNNGELPMILVENHHAPIISKTVFQWVQSEMKRRTSKRKVQQKTARTAGLRGVRNALSAVLLEYPGQAQGRLALYLSAGIRQAILPQFPHAGGSRPASGYRFRHQSICRSELCRSICAGAYGDGGSRNRPEQPIHGPAAAGGTLHHQ